MRSAIRDLAAISHLACSPKFKDHRQSPMADQPFVTSRGTCLLFWVQRVLSSSRYSHIMQIVYTLRFNSIPRHRSSRSASTVHSACAHQNNRPVTEPVSGK